MKDEHEKYREFEQIPEYALPLREEGIITPHNLGGGTPLWSGNNPPPEKGSLISIRVNNLGTARVIGYFTEGGWLGVLAKPVMDTKKLAVFGAEIGTCDIPPQLRTESLAFGLNQELPEGVLAAWGARWIFPDDQVHDRQAIIGREHKEEFDRLVKWLDGSGKSPGAIRKAMLQARKLYEKGTISSNSSDTVTLYEDDKGIIKGNPNGSYGYLYVVGYLKK